jgi:hypothetical protein
MAQGGYRKPENPAPVSGPGALSQRTDGGPTQPAQYISGLPYGEGQATYDQQTAAPMASNNAPQPAIQLPEPTPLMAPTTRPDEPITSGIDIGDGPGSETMMDRPNQSYTLAQTLQQLIKYDPSGDTEMIYRALVDEGY